VPAANDVALLVNPTDPEIYQSTLSDVQAAALGHQILVHEVATGRWNRESQRLSTSERASLLQSCRHSIFAVNHPRTANLINPDPRRKTRTEFTATRVINHKLECAV
jgi:hypothetical protein